METSNNGMQESMAEKATRLAHESNLYALESNAESYQKAIYTFASGKMELLPGVFNDDFNKLLWKHDVISAGFITAWNPIGDHLWDRENDLLNYKLSHWLVDYKKSPGFVKVLRRKASKGWFVYGINKKHLKMLGKKFRQAAVLYVGRDQTPEIVFTTLGIRAARAVQTDLLNCLFGGSPRFAKECNEYYRTPRIVLNFGRPRY